MRPSQTDSRHNTGNDRSDGWNPELGEPPRARSAGPSDAAQPDDGAGEHEVSYETSARAYGAGTSVDRGEAARSWQDIKSRFVDDPTGALEAAEALVQSVVDQKIRALKGEAAAMCERESGEDAASTEDMRTRLLRYQAYCERLARTSP